MVIELFNKGIKSYLEITLPFEIHILQTLLWVLVIYVLIRYIQDVLYIERQYGYLEKLEKEIDCILGKRKIFCREGLAYRDEYPMVLNIITLFYKTMMPLLFTGINTVRIIIEWRTAKVVTISLVCDTILYTAIFVIIWFFFFEMHPKITRFAKKYIPLVDIIDTYIRKMLKEV